ncbi:prepilin peptidase [Listeria seeligeri]|uniref:Methyltransferase n=2 Tax=Listeria seeligeri TaxID=1640 RepID=A0ABR5E8M3_LISSE|nr:A24 family peptidase [Listeria seeligeri]EFS00012.1 type IV leader peptidase family protein [Listeria seeligeri FSL N1-067]KKD46499.1 methyltransferase [Listeria seeligeri]MBC1576259.1 prepilin peptidase [Listeria seeligeri]MBC1585263.1 prepilin peptidase [Listeria seeligeri]MBC1594196.1 prepilin peptidase [Listeria seeligeri]
MIYFLIVIYSTIFISFIQVAAECLPTNKPFLFRFSECNYCKKTLPIHQIIPIFSFLFLKGKSKCCKKSIPISYFLLEMLTPVYILFLYQQFSFSYEFFLCCITYYFLAFFFITDILYMYIPNSIIILFTITLLFVYCLFDQPIVNLIISVGVSMIFYMLFFLIFRKGIGLGDIKLFIILSSFLGFKTGYYIFFLAILIGTIILLIAVAAKKIKKNKQVPFVPYIFTSFMLISVLLN